ncbi:HPr kinase/phosphorylase [Mesorhizobium sp. INR15]|uniref:HPr kinase/phosphorylase n=1 Tax=Mesorhizobium sp. INR15 TaxID=2654248 RepID=UPI0018967A5C|nr:HPr kinase/phosphorylase [Mesorhizobium sp. INR15]QPC89526.1 HPr kinase/phosphorylase [Mesorhizobium sp. INR15]
MSKPSAENIHATVILIGDRGILVTGPSGSGKTTLALALIDHCPRHGLFSRLVGDDQLFVSNHAGRLLCRAPDTIAGLTEVRGFGPRPVLFEPACVIDLWIRLVPGDKMARFQETVSEAIAGCPVPRIDLAERNVSAALPAVMARLSIVPFL